MMSMTMTIIVIIIGIATVIVICIVFVIWTLVAIVVCIGIVIGTSHRPHTHSAPNFVIPGPVYPVILSYLSRYRYPCRYR